MRTPAIRCTRAGWPRPACRAREPSRMRTALFEEIDVVRKLFDEVAPRYADRPGGYTRMVKIGKRPGDNADMAVVHVGRRLTERVNPDGPEVKVSAPAPESPAEGPARCFRATVQYDGTAYRGFQRQRRGPTIQAALENTLARNDRPPGPV
jgi:hypothetical protein